MVCLSLFFWFRLLALVFRILYNYSTMMGIVFIYIDPQSQFYDASFFTARNPISKALDGLVDFCSTIPPMIGRFVT